MKIIIIGPSPNDKGGISIFIRNIIRYTNNHYSYTMHAARPAGNFIKKLLLVPFYTLYYLLRVVICRYDIAHINFSEKWGFYRYIPIVFWSKILGINIVMHCHACEFDKFYSRQNKLLKKLTSYTLDLSKCVIVLSKEWNEVFSNITKSTIYIINNFIKVPELNHYNPYSPYIIITGKLGKRKGYYDLVNVIPEILKNNKHVKFIFCGDGDIEEIRTILKKSNIEKYVYLTGWVDNIVIQKYLTNSLLYILPSYNEGMPLGIIEAMSYGIPIISTTVGGIPSLIENGINGILIEPGNLFQLESAIQTLINDVKLRIKISNNNFNAAKEKFDLESQIKKIYTIYNSILDQSHIFNERSKNIKNELPS